MSSNEFEYDNSKTSDSMVLIRNTKDPRQSHGLLVFVEPKQCQSSSQSLCATNSNVGFRYYQFDVEATDFSGNVGRASASVVVIPKGFDADGNTDPASYFIERMATSPASNIILTKEMMWDTTREDPPDVEGISVSVVQTVSAEMTISGITGDYTSFGWSSVHILVLTSIFQLYFVQMKTKCQTILKT